MCNCRKGKTATPAASKFLVMFPDGTTATKTSEMSAKLAAGSVPGATWTVQGK